MAATDVRITPQRDNLPQGKTDHNFLSLPQTNRQLDDTSRSVFKENVRLNEALGYHIKEVEDLRRMTASLAEDNASLALHKVHWHGQSKQSCGRFHDLAFPAEAQNNL